MNELTTGDDVVNGVEECKVCLFHTGIIGISISQQGICNICQTVEELKQEYGTGTSKGEEALSKIVTKIKKSNKCRYIISSVPYEFFILKL
jgi:hypothetical protein